eukprot:49458-Pleurochrysis_carterae.AAC.4
MGRNASALPRFSLAAVAHAFIRGSVRARARCLRARACACVRAYERRYVRACARFCLRALERGRVRICMCVYAWACVCARACACVCVRACVRVVMGTCERWFLCVVYIYVCERRHDTPDSRT